MARAVVVVVVYLVAAAQLIVAQVDDTPASICVPESLNKECESMSKEATHLRCKTGRDMMDCISLVKNRKADIVNLAPEEFYTAGKEFGLEAFGMEEYIGERFRYKAVAVVPKQLQLTSLQDLKGKKSCHTGVGRMAGWNIPIGTLLSKDVITPDCRGELASVNKFFGKSCAAGNWSPDPEIDAELKRQYPDLCSLCKSSCSTDEPYYGYEGALKCLHQGGGDIAFTKVDAVRNYLRTEPEFDTKYQFLCLNGTTMPLTHHDPCEWAKRPTNVFAYNPSAGGPDKGNDYLRILQQEFTRGRSQPSDWFTTTFVSSSNVSNILPIVDKNTFQEYIGNFISAIEKPLGHCDTKNTIRICVTKGLEEQKCERFRMAAFSRRIRPQIACIPVDTHTDCLESLREGKSDIVTLDAGDIYRAGKYHGLKPVAAERYSNSSDLSYYAVAVVRAKTADDSLEKYLGKKSCHTGYGRTAGWVVPVARMVEESLIPRKQCDRALAVSEFFSGGSCVPGARAALSNGSKAADILCSKCIGDEYGDHKCERTNKERYNGYTGAFRCLVERAGDIAFVNHMTVPSNTDGKNKAEWAVLQASSDYSLLCPSGGLKSVFEYETCNLGKVPTHHVVMLGDSSDEKRLHILSFLASVNKEFHSSSRRPIFMLFGSFNGSSDLIFKDNTINLVAVPRDYDYKKVLGEFYDIAKDMDPDECGNFAAPTAKSPLASALIATVLSILLVTRTISG